MGGICFGNQTENSLSARTVRNLADGQAACEPNGRKCALPRAARGPNHRQRDSRSRSRAGRARWGGIHVHRDFTKSPPSWRLGGDRRRHSVRNNHPSFDLIAAHSPSSAPKGGTKAGGRGLRPPRGSRGREFPSHNHHQVEAAPGPYIRRFAADLIAIRGQGRGAGMFEQVYERADLAYRAVASGPTPCCAIHTGISLRADELAPATSQHLLIRRGSRAEVPSSVEANRRSSTPLRSAARIRFRRQFVSLGADVQWLPGPLGALDEPSSRVSAFWPTACRTG